MTQRWSDEAVTDALPVAELSEYDEEPIFYPSLRLMKFLFVVVTLAAIVASVAVARHMAVRPTASAPTVEAQRGDCLTWPPGAPERPVKVACADEHLFEIADSIATPTTSKPGDAEAGFKQTCAQAVTGYLGPRYDPGGRFVVGMLLTSSARNGRLLCGLQLPSDGIASVGFQGRVADQDQSRVWPAGTCLGIRDGQSTEIPVSCAMAHALEITGTVDLSTVFGQAAPSISAQDAVVRDACGAATSAYLSPAALEATLTLRYQPIDAAGWDAGSRRIACRIGSPEPDGAWAVLVGGAKTGVVINGQAAAPPPSPPAPPSPAAAPVPVVEAEPPSPPVEVPVTVTPHNDESAAVSDEIPHLVDAEAPEPAPELPPAEPLPEAEPAAPDAAG
jgi:hypothetical protein